MSLVQLPDKTLFYQPWGIGDMIMFTPVMLNFKRYFPDTRIDLACRNEVKALMKNCPWIRKIFQLPNPQKRTFRNVFKIFRDIRREHYPLVFAAASVTTTRLGNIFVSLCGAKAIVGNSKKYLFSNKVVYSCPVNHNIHRVDQNGCLFKALMGDDVDYRVEFHKPVSEEDEKKAASILKELGFQNKKLLGVHAGCDPANYHKQWGANKFNQLLSSFLSDYEDACIFCFLGPGEDRATSTYPKDNFEDRVVIIREQLGVVAVLLAECSLVLTSDSGLGHIARAMGTPVLAIMGPANPVEVAPYGPDGHFITLTPILDCMPCRPYQKTCDKKENYCLTKLSVSQVKSQLYNLWEKYTA